MKLPMSIKALAVVFAVGGVGFASPANAYDDYNDNEAGEVFLGIIGQITEGAVERREARREHREFDRYCFRLREKCDWGEGWACRKYWRQCDYE